MFTVRWSPLSIALVDECLCFDRSHESMQMGWTGTLDPLAA